MTVLPKETTRCGTRISPNDQERVARHAVALQPGHAGQTAVVQKEGLRERSATGRVISVPGVRHGRARNGTGSNCGDGRWVAGERDGVRALDGCIVERKEEFWGGGGGE